MAQQRFKWLALVASAVLAASSAFAQDSGPLVDLLLKKGIVTGQEAEELRAELARDASAGILSTISGGKSTVGLSLTGRVQVQYAGLSTDIDNTAADPAATQHFFLRRVYLGAKANLGNGWSANFNYDFAGSTFDAAFIQWRQSDALVVDVGLRKAPIGLEEWYTSSSVLKAIERSPGTRYFVEGNNGRRLGAGSYRNGVFVGGKLGGGIFYNVAVTNPERDETSSGAASAGNATNNNFAYWANLGFTGKAGETVGYTFSGSVGYLPDQGGKTLGVGDDLLVYNAFAIFTAGAAELQLEYFGSKNDHGASAVRDSESSSYSAQGSYLFTDKIEGVARYTFVDSDGRGVQTSDGIRSAPSGGTMDKLTEYFVGANYLFKSHDVKLQVGYIYGESEDTLAGAEAKATTSGVRSQLQLQF